MKVRKNIICDCWTRLVIGYKGIARNELKWNCLKNCKNIQRRNKEKEKKNVYKELKLMWLFFHVIADVTIKIRYISIQFNVFILDMSIGQTVCHVGIFC